MYELYWIIACRNRSKDQSIKKIPNLDIKTDDKQSRADLASWTKITWKFLTYWRNRITDGEYRNEQKSEWWC